MSDRDSINGFLIGFIVGGLTGAVVSLLLAPQSGEETRAVLREKAIELKDKATDTAEEAYARAESAAADARLRAEEWARIARERAEDLQKRGQVILEEQRTRLGNVLDTARKGDSTKGDVKPTPPTESEA